MPNVSIVQKVVASDGAAQDWFGSAVAISGDLAVFGSPDAQIGTHAAQGAVYVFRRINGVWTQAQKIVASDGGVSDRFGQAVALLGPKVLVVAAPFATVNGQTWVGAVYIFEFDGKSWLQRQKLTPDDASAFGTFGRGLALTQTYLLIGAGGASVNSVHVQGSVYIFRFLSSSSGGVWSQVQKIGAPDPGDDTAFFGYPLAISGSTALVGSYAATVNGNLGQGAVYAYKFLGGNWTQTAKLVAFDGGVRANFGVSVALEGKTAFIGAPGATVHGNVSQGSVYRFEEQGAHWTQVQQLVVQNGVPISWFGSSVNYQSPTLLIGSYAINSYTGAAYVFTRSGNNAPFTLSRKLTANDGRPGDVFGYFSALDGNTALVTAWGADIGTNLSQGAAYFYKLFPATS
jgi:hypothetical protein